MIARDNDVTDLDAREAAMIYDKLNRLGRLYILRAFKELGVLSAAGERYRVQALKKIMAVSPEYGRLFDLLLIMLKNGGFISLNHGEIAVLARGADRGVQEITQATGELQREIVGEHPEMTATVASIARCLDPYAAVITGRMSPVEALFPNGSMELVENLYTHNKIQDFFNRVVGKRVKECVGRAAGESPSARLSILEIGAGTGSATAHVLRAIDGFGNLEYCYTDIASAFTAKGEGKFGAGHPFMTFKTLDIEENLAIQGFAPAAWDIAVASNVLHATRRIDHTLRQVRRLLKPGGVLIMNEVTIFQEIVNAIFGLTSGWWLFEDPERRIGHGPSLSVSGWKAALEEAGFSQVNYLGLPHDSEDNPMQCVMVAENSGPAERSDSVVKDDQEKTPVIGRTEDQPVRSGRRERIEADVRSLMFQASEIQIRREDGDTNLFELGFASLMIARLKDLIKRAYGLDLQMSWFYSRTDTFNKVVGYIDRESKPDDGTPEQEPGRVSLSDAGALTPGRIDGEAEGIIGRQIELMDRQLTVMSEQLSALRSAGKGVSTQRPGDLRVSPVPEGERKGKIGGGGPEAPSPIPAAEAKRREEYVAYRGVTGREKLELNERQKGHLQKLVGRYTGLTAGSKALTQKYRPVFANTRNIAGFRPEWKEMIYQIIVQKAGGSHFTDIDGRDYLDITMGFGVYLLGHNPPFVQAALQEELRRGTPIGPMTELAGKAATLVHELTGVERVAFFNTGTEAVMAAVRIARTVTGRRKIALFSSSYHGHFDGLLAVKDYDGPQGRAVPMSPGTPSEMVQDVYVLDYGTEEALQFIEAHGRELAAVLVEPVQSRRPDLQPKAFLERVRELTTVSESALIFDEMIIGFRIHPGGGQAWFGIRADIVTYGKIVGGGNPIGVVAGKARFLDAVDGGMWNYGDGSFPERENTFIAGTFNHHPLAMAGANAVLGHLKASGPSLQENLNRRTDALAARLNGYFSGEGLPIGMDHFGSLFHIRAKGDQELLYYHLLCRGVYIWEGRNCFLSTAHTDADIETLVQAIQESVEEMRAGGLFEGMKGRVLRSSGAEEPLEAASSGMTYPMSSAQKRIYVLSQTKGGELAYHISGVLVIDGALDRGRLEACFGAIIDRHESLRAGFVIMDDTLVQQVCNRLDFNISYFERPSGNIDAIVRECIRPFDLAKPPLLRASLVRLTEDRHLLVVDAHHIIFDGISGYLFLSELIKRYGGETAFPSAAPYRDYVEMEQDYLAGDEYGKHERYWGEKFSSAVPPLDLPADFSRPPVKTFRGGKIFRKLDSDATRKVRSTARSAGVSLHMILFAAYFLLLHKLTGNEDVVVGTTYDGRGAVMFGSSIGMFVNTVPVRCQPEGTKTFRAFLDEVKREVLDAYDRREYPFEDLVKKLSPDRDMSRNPLFDTMFVYETQEGSSISSGGVTFTEFNCSTQTSIFDMTLDIADSGSELNISLEYATDLFRRETAERYLSGFLNILDQIIVDPDRRMHAVEILSEGEKRHLVKDFNATFHPYRTDVTIVDLFEEQVQKTPDNRAVICGKVCLTYRELNEKANRLAHYLRKRHAVKPDDIVGIMLDRSEWMIIGLFGILKSGAAYLPIEPSYPRERALYMVRNSGCKTVLTDGVGLEGVESVDIRGIKQGMKSNPSRTAGSRNLAYVLYTSGSTGHPKGVMIEHRSIVNRLGWMERKYPLEKNGIILQKTPFTFDVSVWELFWWSWYGSSVCMLAPGDHKDPGAITEAVHRFGVTKMHFVPSMLSVFLEYLSADPENRVPLLKSLRQVFSSGEALGAHWVELFNRLLGRARGITLHNLYGPTEATVDVSYYDCPTEEVGGVVPIGKPIDNIELYIVDTRYGNLVPVGVPGELWIGGDGLARGYLNNPELTAEKFIPHPFQEGRKVYKSGDLCRWMADGNVEYLGRLDHQVKIRGNRIELGEIENILLRQPGIEQAAVIVREDKAGDRFLCSYLVTLEDLDIEGLRSRLGVHLPDYMIPSRFLRIKEMPLTSNGKADRKALLSIEGEDLKHETEFVGPQTEHEALLVGIWKDVLRRDEIGVLDNYFTLGGDSIKAIQILSRLNQHHLTLEIGHVFETPTIRALAKKLSRKKRIPPQGMVTGRVPLTAIQARFFRFYDKGCHHYAQAVLLCAQDRVDEPALRLALLKLQEHHDALRMIFHGGGDAPVQQMAGIDYPLGFTVVDLKGRENQEQERERLCSQVPPSLDLKSGPMMKSVLFRQDDQDRLLIVVHHLAIDGVSWRILLEDLNVGYEQALSGATPSLPPKTDSFKAWAEKIARYGTDAKLLAEMPFWRQLEETEALAIPPDFEGTANRYEDARTVFVELGGEETLALMTKANRAYHTEVNDLLLTALGRAMKRSYGSEKGFIDLEGHGREPLFADLDIGRTVGWFTSIYPVIVDITESEEQGIQIKQVKEGLRRVPNRGVGYGVLKYLSPMAEGTGMPFNRRSRILFNYLGSFDVGGRGRFSIEETPAKNLISGLFERPSEIEIEGVVIEGRLKIGLSFSMKIHREETVNKFLQTYRDELRRVIDHCISRPGAELTPHDLTYKDLTMRDLDRILAECGIPPANLKDVYPLSPLQEGMLFHAMLENGLAAYFMQTSFEIDGELDLALFEDCWNRLFLRHDILRTVFIHKGADRPLQVVVREGRVDFRYEDISALSEERQSKHLAKARKRDRDEGFDPTAKVPMRVNVFKKDERSFEVLWSYHHILIDGWCAGILMSEFFRTYDTLRRGGVPDADPAAPFGAYIRWIENLDRPATIEYWRDYLRGYDRSAVLPRRGIQEEAKGFRPETVILEIDVQTGKALKRFSASHQVTLNTVIQAVWGLVLSRYSGADDVVFGATISGRPAQVADIEKMAGLFINTVPVRIKLRPEKTVAQLIRDVQADALKSEPHHYCSLADVQAATSLKQGLLDHVLVFENYPLAQDLIGLERKYRLGFRIGEVKVIEQTNYDLTIVVEPGEQMRIEFRYNAQVFPEELMEQVKETFRAIISSTVAEAGIRIGDLRLSVLSAEERRERDAFIRSAAEISEDF